MCQDHRGHTKTNEPTSLQERWRGGMGADLPQGSRARALAEAAERPKGLGRGYQGGAAGAHCVSGPGQAGSLVGPEGQRESGAPREGPAQGPSKLLSHCLD